MRGDKDSGQILGPWKSVPRLMFPWPEARQEGSQPLRCELDQCSALMLAHPPEIQVVAGGTARIHLSVEIKQLNTPSPKRGGFVLTDSSPPLRKSRALLAIVYRPRMNRFTVRGAPIRDTEICVKLTGLWLRNKVIQTELR